LRVERKIWRIIMIYNGEKIKGKKKEIKKKIEEPEEKII